MDGHYQDRGWVLHHNSRTSEFAGVEFISFATFCTPSTLKNNQLLNTGFRLGRTKKNPIIPMTNASPIMPAATPPIIAPVLLVPPVELADADATASDEADLAAPDTVTETVPVVCVDKFVASALGVLEVDRCDDEEEEEEEEEVVDEEVVDDWVDEAVVNVVVVDVEEDVDVDDVEVEVVVRMLEVADEVALVEVTESVLVRRMVSVVSVILVSAPFPRSSCN